MFLYVCNNTTHTLLYTYMYTMWVYIHIYTYVHIPIYCIMYILSACMYMFIVYYKYIIYKYVYICNNNQRKKTIIVREVRGVVSGKGRRMEMERGK